MSLPNKKTGRLSVTLKVFLLTFSIILFTNPTYSQRYQCYDQLTSEDGLSQSTVNCILQDKDGFIWMGTQDGLNMYDGYKFTYFQNQPSDSNSLSNNYILSICEDQEGFIWIGTMSGGLNKFNKYSGSFKVFQHTDDPVSISDNSIWTVTNDDLDNIWTGTNYGVNVFNKKDQSFYTFRYSENDTNSIPSDVVMNIFNASGGNIWIGSNKGLARFNKKNSNFKRIGREDSDLIVWTINQLTDEKLIIGANSGLWELNTITEDLNKVLMDEKEETVWTIMPDNNRIWFGTRSGVKILDNTKLQCDNISFDEENSKEDGDLNTWCLMMDKSGFIWAGTDKGVFKIKSDEAEFRTINANPENEPNISVNSVNTILIDHSNSLWIGTEGGGLNYLKDNSNEFSTYKANNLLNNSLSSNNVWALLEDHQGTIWIGTYGGGLNAFDRNTEQFTVHKRNKSVPGSISNNRILALHEDSKGDIWIGTRSGGLNRYDRSTDKFETFIVDPDDSTSISSNTVLSIAEDTLGNLWIGTFEGGINILNTNTKNFKSFKTDQQNPNSISNNNVWVILFDRQYRLWLGTQGGLNLVTNPYSSDFSFTHFTTKQGLPSNVIFGLAEDANNNIWMSTFRGVARHKEATLQQLIEKGENISTYVYDPFNPLFTVFEASDGLQSNEFNQGAHFQSESGEIYFGGPKGLNIFHPDSLKISDFSPPVVLTSFKIFNKEVLSRSDDSTDKNRIFKENDQYYLLGKISYLEEIKISYRESVFSIDFASLDYSLPSKNQYAYLMEGFDKEWNYIGNKTSATYTNLDAGHYIFRVRGTNADGVWSDQEARLEITITPPFWKTIWFITLVIILVLAVAFLIIRQIFLNQKKKAEAEREKMELQLKTIKNQMDPHFAFNAINMIGSLVYKNDPDTVYDYFSRFARLIRSTLQDSEKISRPLKDELEFVKNYVEIQKTRFKGKFDFDLNVSDSTNLETEVPKMVIQTHAENAIKHGLMHKKSGGLLQINIDQTNGLISISIEDNGIGRAEAAKVSRGSTGKGMNIIKQIFTLYNKIFNYKIDQQVIDLADENGNPEGTKVVLTIEKNID